MVLATRQRPSPEVRFAPGTEFDATKRIDYPITTALNFVKAPREERMVNTRDSKVARDSLLLYRLRTIVVTTRFPRGAQRTRRNLGSPNLRCAWTD